MDKRERVLRKVNNSKGFTKALRGVENGKKLQKKLSETKMAETEDGTKILTSFSSPFAGTNIQDKRQKGDKDKRNSITLMEATTQNGKQELKLDIDSKKTSFITTAKRNIDDKGLSEDMKSISPNTAKKQRRTDDYNLLLARGKKDAAAEMELPKQRNWTDKVVNKLAGDNRSDMMNRMCPYADTEKDEIALKHARQELIYIKKELSENKNSEDMAALRMQEGEAEKKIEKLANIKSKKNMQKGILIQKLKYSTNPTLNKKFYSQFSEDNIYKSANNQEVSEETNNEDIDKGEYDSNEPDQVMEGDSEE